MSENKNPNINQLRELVQGVDSFEICNFGAYAVSTRVKTPSDIVELNEDLAPLCSLIEDSLSEDTIVVDGHLCPTPGNALHVRLEVPAAYVHLALCFKMVTYNSKITVNDTFQDPDVVVFCNPDVPVGKVNHVNRGGFTKMRGNSAVIVDHGLSFIAGSDLFEDVLNGLMKAAAKIVESRCGVIIPGAIKEVRSFNRKNDKRFCIIGQPGTGVTRTAFGGERSGLYQDGFIQLMRMGLFYPVMNASHTDVEGLTNECKSLNKVVTSGDCFLENAHIVDGFVHLDKSVGGKAVIGIGSVEYNVPIDRPEGSDAFVLLIKDDGILPGVVRVGSDQFLSYLAAYADEWGLTTKELDNIFMALRNVPMFEGYIINTGSTADGRGVITQSSIQSILTDVAKGGIQWKLDREMGWEYCPHQINDCDMSVLEPSRAYAVDVRSNEYRAKARLQTQEVRELLRAKYPDMPEPIFKAVAKPVPSTEIEILHKEAVARGEKVFQHPVTGEAILTELAHWSRGYCGNSDNSDCTFCPFHE